MDLPLIGEVQKTCSKCGEPRPATRSYFDFSIRDGLSASCKCCRRKTGKSHYEANKEKYFEAAERRRQEVAAFIRSLKDQPCSDCGRKFPHYVMDFDHREGKSVNLSHPRVKRWGKERILREASKCDVVCANCHRIRTYERGQHQTYREVH